MCNTTPMTKCDMGILSGVVLAILDIEGSWLRTFCHTNDRRCNFATFGSRNILDTVTISTNADTHNSFWIL